MKPARTTTRPVTGYADHAVIGTPGHVANVITNHYQTGTLVSVTPLPATTDGRIAVQLRLRTTEAATTPRTTPAAPKRSKPRRDLSRLAIVATAIAAPIGGLVIAAAYYIGALVEYLTQHVAVIIGFLAVVAVVAAALRSLAGGGPHCPGPFHR